MLEDGQQVQTHTLVPFRFSFCSAYVMTLWQVVQKEDILHAENSTSPKRFDFPLFYLSLRLSVVHESMVERHPGSREIRQPRTGLPRTSLALFTRDEGREREGGRKRAGAQGRGWVCSSSVIPSYHDLLRAIHFLSRHVVPLIRRRPD